MLDKNKSIFFVLIFLNSFLSASAGEQVILGEHLLPAASINFDAKGGKAFRRFEKISKHKSYIYPALCFLTALLIGGEIAYNVSPTNDSINNNDVNTSMFNCLLPDGSQKSNADSLSSVEGMNWRIEISNCQGRFNFTSKVQAPLPNAKLYQLAFYMPDLLDFAGSYPPMQRCDNYFEPVTTYCARTVNEPYEENDNGGQFISQVMRTLRTGVQNKSKNLKEAKTKHARTNNNTRKAFDRMNGLYKTGKKGR